MIQSQRNSSRASPWYIPSTPVTKVIPTMVVKNLWNVIQSAKNDPNVLRLQTTVEKIILDGYPLGILLSMFTDYVIHNAGGFSVMD